MFRFLMGVVVMVLLSAVALEAQAQSQGPAPARSGSCKILVAGFAGGLDTPNNRFSGVVKIRKQLQALNNPELCVKTFSAYHWMGAYHWIAEYFPSEREGHLSNEEIQSGPKIILYGHSLGGWACLSLARLLDTKGIPVELTVQIDSVGFTDSVVPPNVKAAANFYHRATLPFLTRQNVRAENENSTQVLGNSRIPHVGHITITRRPEIAALIVDAVRTLSAAVPAAESRAAGSP